MSFHLALFSNPVVPNSQQQLYLRDDGLVNIYQISSLSLLRKVFAPFFSHFRAPLIFAHQGRAKIKGGKFAHQGCAKINPES